VAKNGDDSALCVQNGDELAALWFSRDNWPKSGKNKGRSQSRVTVMPSGATIEAYEFGVEDFKYLVIHICYYHRFHRRSRHSEMRARFCETVLSRRGTDHRLGLARGMSRRVACLTADLR